MVFKKMLSGLGVGGPSVDTVLTNPNTRPGLELDGLIHLRGGTSPVQLHEVTLALTTLVETEIGDTEHAGLREFHRLPVSGPLQLAPGQELSIPFQFPVPWETPITNVYDQRLRGMTMGLRTELAVARAVDKSDLDSIFVHPLPVQERILAAFAQLGFQFKHADLQHGRIYGVQQTLPFYQEIEFFAAPQYSYAVREVELTLVANPYTVDVIIQCDKRSGPFAAGHDSVGRYVVEHANAERVDWTGQVDAWLSETVARHGTSPAHHGHGHRHHGYDHYDHDHHGHGVGGAVAGAALGFAGGMIAGEVLEEVFDNDDDGGFWDGD